MWERGPGATDGRCAPGCGWDPADRRRVHGLLFKPGRSIRPGTTLLPPPGALRHPPSSLQTSRLDGGTSMDSP